MSVDTKSQPNDTAPRLGESPQSKSHFVYILVCKSKQASEAHFKIGLSSDPRRRIETLRSQCPIPAKIFCLVDAGPLYAAQRLERLLLSRYADYRTSGEWFAFEPNNLEHKRAFNEGWRKCFDAVLGPGRSWAKYDIAALDTLKAVGIQRQKLFSRSRKVAEIRQSMFLRANA